MTDDPISPNPQPLTAKPSRLQITIILLAAFVVALAAGWPTLKCGFTSGDDQRFITDHSLVAHPSLDNALKLLTIVHGDLYQPFPMLTFQTNYALAENQPKDRFGINPFGFHLTNVVLHAINAMLVTLLALRISRREAVALLTGLLFACHPFAVESVGWLPGRMMLLAAMFALITVLICLSKRPHNSVLATIAWVFSLASKILPTVPLATAWIDYKQRGKFDRGTTLNYILLLIMAAAAAAFAIFTTQQAGFVTDDAEFKSSAVVQFLSASRYYIENYFVPTRLSPWVPPADGVNVTSPECMFAAIELLALASLALTFRKRLPLAHLGLILFALLILPFLATPTARRFLAADRYMYLPIVGLHLAIAAMLVALSDTLDRVLKPSFCHRFLVLPSAAILIPCLLLSWSYSLTWTDTISRDQRAAFVYPDNPLTQYELAKAYNFSDRPHDAIDVIAKARERWPDHPRLIAQAGEAYRLLQDWPAAERELRAAAAQMPGHTTTQYHLALALEKLNRTDDAIQTLETLVGKNPGYLPAWTALGRLRLAADREPAAIDAFNRALQINPTHRGALLGLAELHIAKQDWTSAIPLLRKITASDSKDAQATFQLAVALVQVDQSSEAFEIYSRLIERDEKNVTLRFNRAAVAQHLGNLTVAEQDYALVAIERPELLEPYVALHEILVAQLRFKSILELWQFRSAKLGETNETKACLVWGLVLAEHCQDAIPFADSITPASPDRILAQWAILYDAVRRGDEAAANHLAGAAFGPNQSTTFPVENNWRARIIRASLQALPTETKRSRMGRFVLAWFLMFDGKSEMAVKTLEQILTEKPEDKWTKAAGEWLQLWRQPSSQENSD